MRCYLLSEKAVQDASQGAWVTWMTTVAKKRDTREKEEQCTQNATEKPLLLAWWELEQR
jgi:hypothetical protein